MKKKEQKIQSKRPFKKPKPCARTLQMVNEFLLELEKLVEKQYENHKQAS